MLIFQMKLEIRSDNPVDIKLYNLSGMLIKSYNSHINQPLDLSYLSSGTYILKINNYQYRKLIKK